MTQDYIGCLEEMLDEYPQMYDEDGLVVPKDLKSGLISVIDSPTNRINTVDFAYTMVGSLVVVFAHYVI